MTDEEYLLALARHIKRLRLANGLTQKSLAEKLGTNHTAIVRLEKGGHNSQITSLRAVADALNVTIGELVTVNEER